MISPTLNRPQADFLAMPNKFRAYVAGFGCVRGDTLIATERGLIPIQEINAPIRVLSWSEKNNRFELSLSGGAFPKGKANLYRICTQQGEFVAAGHHRVFCADRKYRRVDSLCVGDKVLSSSPIPPQTNLGSVPKSSHADDQSLMQKLEDYLGDYADEARLYGQQLLQEEDTDQGTAPKLDDAQELRQLNVGIGDLVGRVRKHSHQGQYSCHNCKSDCSRHAERREKAAFYCESAKYSEHALRSIPIDLLSPQTSIELYSKGQGFGASWCHPFLLASGAALTVCHNERYNGTQRFVHNQPLTRPAKQSDQGMQENRSGLLSQSLFNTTPKTSHIISITQLAENEVFYDLQVLDNNNYVTADGTVHHNSGKTWVGCCSLMQHFYRFPLVNAGYFAPSYPQIRDIFYPTIEEVADQWGLEVEILVGNKEVKVYRNGEYRGLIICRSMDKPSTIVGFKIGHALIDEIDTMHTDKALSAWRKIIARMRYKRDGLKNGIDIATTPEGFKFVYGQFVKAVRDNPELGTLYGLIQASTYDNEKNLPDGYIESLRQSYPPQLIEAYLNGQFVNLESGAVWNCFERKLNHTDAVMLKGEPLHIGMDFNVLKMAAVIYVIRDGMPYAVDELTGVRDTPTMAQLIKERFGEDHAITIYPDASGQNTSSKEASNSDFAILSKFGFRLVVDRTNPSIKDRVNATNAMLCNGLGERHMFINTNRCPDFTAGLEQQVYDKNGMPDKAAGVDHVTDAGTYPIVKLYPIKNRVSKQTGLRL